MIQENYLGGGCDKSDQVVSHSNTCAVLIWVSIMTQWVF